MAIKFKDVLLGLGQEILEDTEQKGYVLDYFLLECTFGMRCQTANDRG